MSAKKQRAVATAPKQLLHRKSYTKSSGSSRADRIQEHLTNMPRQYRNVYSIAMSGQSLRAAVNSQCIECMGYSLSQVKECCSPQCPLFLYRPLNGVSYGVSGMGQNRTETTKKD